MNALTVFQFDDDMPLRTVVDDNGDPLAVAADVCKALDYANTAQTVQKYVDAEDRFYLTDIGGISQTYTPNSQLLINESGLFALILGSQRPEAKRFKRWVTSEVLPALRKTGSYAIQKLTPAEQLLAQAQQLVDHERQLANHGERIERLEAEADAQKPDYWTIKGWCNYHRLRSPTDAEARALGRRAVKMSKARGLPVTDIPNGEWGTIHQYDESVLDELLKDWK